MCSCQQDKPVIMSFSGLSPSDLVQKNNTGFHKGEIPHTHTDTHLSCVDSDIRY